MKLEIILTSDSGIMIFHHYGDALSDNTLDFREDPIVDGEVTLFGFKYTPHTGRRDHQLTGERVTP